MANITAETFYKQLTGSYSGAIVATVLGGVIVGGCAFFCGTQMGWTNILSVILLATAAICAALLVFFIIRIASVKNHAVFRRYGSADDLAEKINDGLSDPLYLAHALMGNSPFATLLTSDFIVSGGELVSYMELKDMVSVKAAGFRDVHIINITNPVTIGASLAADKLGERYLQSKGVNSQTRFDQLIMTDTDGKEHYYGVQHKDVVYVLTKLQQVAPHIRLMQG